MQSKNGVDLVEVSIFYKLEKTSSQTIWPLKIKNSSAFVFYHGSLVFKHFFAFTILWAYPFQIMKLLH